MKHNSAQALEAAKDILKKLKVKYETIKVQEFKPGLKIEQTGLTTNVWVVGYTYTVFEEAIFMSKFLNEGDFFMCTGGHDARQDEERASNHRKKISRKIYPDNGCANNLLWRFCL